MITKGHDINMASHKLNYIPKTDATVTETGNDEYWQCTVCDKYFSDAEGTNEVTVKLISSRLKSLRAKVRA